MTEAHQVRPWMCYSGRVKRLAILFPALLLVACAQAEDVASSSAAVKGPPFIVAQRDLFEVFDVSSQSGGMTYHVSTTDPIETALREYVAQSNAKAPDFVPLFEYHLNASDVETGTDAVGTVAPNVAWRVMKRDLAGYLFADDDRIAKARSAFERLVANGAVFGYDASRQSGCAAPTGFLLIIDPQESTVFTLETTPCTK